MINNRLLRIKQTGGIMVSKTTYKGGATRSSDVEPYRYDLVPPEGIRAAAMAMAEGAKNHGENNWKKGMSMSVIMNHAMYHITQHMVGDRSEDHLGHAIANLCMAVWTFECNKEYDDIKYGSEKQKQDIDLGKMEMEI